MKTIRTILITVALVALATVAFAQNVGINSDGSAPASSAMLDVSSTTKGFLPPRMTYAQKILISSPPAGLMIWCSDCGTTGELQVYNGITWTNFIGGTAAGLPDAPTIGTVEMASTKAFVPFTAPVFDGGSEITLYTATSSPGNITGTLNQAGSGTIVVNGLTDETAYTFTVTATNEVGTGAASVASNSITPWEPEVGDSYGGGIIFYIYVPGDHGYVSGRSHGLISATSNQSAGIVWATADFQSITVTGTNGGVGYGSSSTDAIIAQNCTCGSYAANLARSYTGGGYSDWFLPSYIEIGLMYLQKAVIGGFSNAIYWTSSQYTAAGSVYVKDFTNGTNSASAKSASRYVRAIRSF